MAAYLLEHRHRPDDCGVAFAAWKGFESPLRGHRTVCSCFVGGHTIWWLVEAGDPVAALAQLPEYVAERTTVVEVTRIMVP